MPDPTQVETLLKAVIGKNYSEALRAQLSEQTGRTIRPLGGKFAGTMDYQPERISLYLNDAGVIDSYRFG